jgi:hypothetical protein
MAKTASLGALILIAALSILSVPACQKKQPLIPGLQPLTGENTGAEARLTLFNTLHMGLRFLDADNRARYLREVAGQNDDPFLPALAGQEEPFLVFLFTVDNQGQEPALISPSFASLLDKKGKINIGPVDLDELSGLLASHPAFTPKVSRRCHRPTINVNPGERHTKLLIFPTLGRRVKILDVVLPSVMVGHLTADAHFPFTVTWEPAASF